MAKDTFCGFRIEPHATIQNAWCVAGDNVAAYQDFYRNIGENIQNIETYPNGNTAHVTLDPARIEGILLDEHAVSDPTAFWSQHRKNGTMKTFLEIARRIPDVEFELRRGHSLLSLLRNPELGQCASIYFDMRRPDALHLVDCGSFYWFQSNGRHRVLAARAAGCSIPARITGRLGGL